MCIYKRLITCQSPSSPMRQHTIARVSGMIIPNCQNSTNIKPHRKKHARMAAQNPEPYALQHTP